MIREVVVAAREAGTDHGDLLSMLLLARDEDTGEGMTDEQVHDEVVTILTTGAETTAVALAWFFHELGQHPEVERRFHAEIDQVLGGPPGDVSTTCPDLEYTQRIVNEILRRNPPLILMRRAREDVDARRRHHPARAAEVAVSQHTLHRDPRWFPDPDRFDPDRWLPGAGREAARGRVHPVRRGRAAVPGPRVRPDRDRHRRRHYRGPLAAGPGAGQEGPCRSSKPPCSPTGCR